MKNLTNSEPELKKSVPYKKSVYTKMLTVFFLISAEHQIKCRHLIINLLDI